MGWFDKKKEELKKDETPWGFAKLKEFFEKESQKEGNSAKFQAVVNAFAQYEQARSKTVSEQSAKDMVLANQALLSACETYTKERKGARTSGGKERLDAIQRLVDFQKQQNLDEIRDLRLVRELVKEDERNREKNPESTNRTWEQMGAIPVPDVTLTGDEKIVGTQVNRRFQVEYKEKVGFFTERKEIKSPNEILKEMVEKVDKQAEPERRKRMEENLGMFIQIFGAEIVKTKDGDIKINANTKYETAEADADTVKRILTAERDKSKGKKRMEQLNQLIQDEKTIQDLVHAMENIEASKAAQSEGFLEYDKGDELTDRNVATSRIAELFGMGDLIAHSRKMVAHKDGKTMSGCFMEFANGIDFQTKNPEEKEKIKQIGTIETPGFNRAVCNIEILDLICGQMDRHSGNMFYQLSEPDENGKRSIVGVQGIDNDLAFSKKIKGRELTGQKTASVDSLTFIDKEFAAKVKTIGRDDLDFALGDLISKEQIDALEYRMFYIKERLNSGNMVELNPDEWALDEYKLSDYKDCKRVDSGTRVHIFDFGDANLDARGRAYVNGLLDIEESKKRLEGRHKKVMVEKVVKGKIELWAREEAREKNQVREKVGVKGIENPTVNETAAEKKETTKTTEKKTPAKTTENTSPAREKVDIRSSTNGPVQATAGKTDKKTAPQLSQRNTFLEVRKPQEQRQSENSMMRTRR